ncbi:hypothetical protein HGRIS_005204 [Hohenbuehelia grisea]|uniref:AB hydrolase-1 domain-containing protein n=1 Tax=Hohenbuehelia grisea TaxID=104357 RepID=A0ABR3JET2_9AGAR
MDSELKLAPIDDQGTVLAYQDSGPPSTGTYATYVLIHGYSFHSGIFGRLIPLANDANVRLVCLNRRGFAKSTPLREGEFEFLCRPNNDNIDIAAHQGFVRARGSEIATFLHWFIRAEGLPPREGDAGGVTLVGWSFGNLNVIAFLANTSTYQPAHRELIGRHLKEFVVWDPPHFTLGLKDPESSYHPTTDPDVPTDKRQAHFAQWISSFFPHSDEALATRDPVLLEYKRPNPSKASTLSRMPPETFKMLLDPRNDGKSEGPGVLGVYFPVLDEQVKKVFVERVYAESWPGVKGRILWGTESQWMVVYGAWYLEKLAKSASLSAQTHAPIVSVPFSRVNHFPHWDDPETTLKALVASN